MPPITLLITYPKEAFRGGETLDGKVKVHLEKSTEISSSTTSHHKNLGAGEHHFPFTLALPSPLPETFKQGYGEVWYYCEASVQLHKSIGKSEYKMKKPFTVHANAAIIPSGNYRNPSSIRETPEPKKLAALLKLNKVIYTPGEDVILSAEITNQTNFVCSNLKALLNQTIRYCSSQDKENAEKIEENTICILTSPDKVPPGSNYVWQNAVLKVPQSTPATNLGGCSLIDVNYEVKVSMVEGSGFCSSKKIYQLPLIIGPSDANSNGISNLTRLSHHSLLD